MFPKEQGLSCPQKATMFSREKKLLPFEDMIVPHEKKV
jgi:hypothetical protein